MFSLMLCFAMFAGPHKGKKLEEAPSFCLMINAVMMMMQKLYIGKKSKLVLIEKKERTQQKSLVLKNSIIIRNEYR
jgi:hypothetical protein